MADKNNPVSVWTDGLSYEEQLEAIPDLPARPVLYADDYPTGELASLAQSKYQMARWERERDAQQALSGYLTSYATRGPTSPQEKARDAEEQAEYRENCYGLPDSPEDMLPMAGGERERPF